MTTFVATTALPYRHLERATAALRAQLRHQLLAADPAAVTDWTPLTVTGPQEFTDEHGHTWFGYSATLDPPGPDDGAV